MTKHSLEADLKSESDTDELMGEAEGKDLTFDDWHNSPNADWVLISTENVAFKVDSWYLE